MIKAALLLAIRGYRFAVSPWTGNSCRFWPTCSEYGMEAIERHGALRGIWMIAARLARCHPYSAGGIDRVPQQFRLRCWCQQDDSAAAPRHLLTDRIR